MTYYLEPDSHITDKNKVVLDLSNYSTKKKNIGVNTSNLDAKRNLIALKAEVDKRGINKLINVPTSLNDLNTKVGALDFGNLEAVTKDLKKLSNVVSKEVVKNTKFNKLNRKVNSLEDKISDAITIFHINQYNTDKKWKKRVDADKNIPDVKCVVTATVLNTKIIAVEKNIPDTSSYYYCS